MKIISKSLLIVLLVFSLFSCRPFSKESYLKRYDEFMTEVSSKEASYTDKDWKKADEKYKKFNQDWYDRFKEELTLQEKLTTTKYNIQYSYFKSKAGALNFFDTYLKGDLEKLKEQIKFYKENKMDADIESLLKRAKEIGDSSVLVIQGIISEVEKNLDKKN